MQLTWLKIDVEAAPGYKPPFFAGSMLRGAIGVALKRVVCINPSYRCEGCFAADDCLYHRFYEEKDTFHPYRVVAKLGMERLAFSVFLYEEATGQLPYVLSAIRKALEEIGLGREKRPVKLASVRIGGRIVYDGERFLSIDGIVPNELTLDGFHTDAKLHFSLPLRIKHDNRLAKEVPLHVLVGNLQRRFRQIKGLPPEKLGYKVRGEVVHSRLKHLDLHRYPNRQRSRMKLGGLVGDMVVKGLDKQSWFYLKAGEILGAGKQTVFGLGSYALIPLKEAV